MRQQTNQIQLSELLGALSVALDMTEGQPEGHCKRTCWIGTNIGLRLGLDDTSLHDLYYTLLLKDLGCTSNAARICQLFLHDDIGFKRDFLQLDPTSKAELVKFILSHAGKGHPIAERLRAMTNIAVNQERISRELIDVRCERGAEIARQMRFDAEVCEGIANLDEHWDGSGHPRGLSGTQIPLHSQIALLAQVADVIATSEGPDAAVAEIRRRSGKWFDPMLVSTFEEVATDDRMWAVWGSDDLEERLFALEPARTVAHVDEDYLDDIAYAFAQIIDSKSPFTSGHSERVTYVADVLAKELGLDEGRRRWLRRAALLHDIGKLGVSNTILDKPGELTPEEWASIRMHPVYTEQVLSRIPAFADMTPVAVAHHERLDGKGYPHGLSGDDISFETRIITTADVFDALTADRPYRPAMSTKEALDVMDDMAENALDPRCLVALRTCLADIDPMWRSDRDVA